MKTRTKGTKEKNSKRTRTRDGEQKENVCETAAAAARRREPSRVPGAHTATGVVQLNSAEI